MAQAPALLSEMSSPWEHQPRSCLQENHLGLYLLCMGGCGAMGLFPNIFEGSLKSPCNSWESLPCSAGASFHLCTAGEAPQAQLKNHLCTSSGPGTAVKATQGTAGRVISAQLALVGLSQEHIQSQGPGMGLLRAVGRAGHVSLWWFNGNFSLCTGQGHGWAEGARGAELC